jgi:hypothetical protein
MFPFKSVSAAVPAAVAPTHSINFALIGRVTVPPVPATQTVPTEVKIIGFVVAVYVAI